MKLINLTANMPKSRLLDILRDNDFVNGGVKFDEKLGKPMMHLSEKGSGIRITCELTGRATKDDSFFLLGTYFKGKITETDGQTRLSGYVITAPVYHLVWAVLILIFILQCIHLGGFSVVPICLIAVNFFMLGNEYKKQGLIERYIKRAIRRADERKY